MEVIRYTEQKNSMNASEPAGQRSADSHVSSYFEHRGNISAARGRSCGHALVSFIPESIRSLPERCLVICDLGSGIVNRATLLDS